MAMTAPPDETAWLLHHVLGFEGMAEADTASVLGEATRMAEGLLGPLDRVGDQTGATWADGVVTPPPGFEAAFREIGRAHV